MKTVINSAIEALAKKIDANVTPDEALKFTQAALNLAHTLNVLTDLGPLVGAAA